MGLNDPAEWLVPTKSATGLALEAKTTEASLRRLCMLVNGAEIESPRRNATVPVYSERFQSFHESSQRRFVRTKECEGAKNVDRLGPVGRQCDCGESARPRVWWNEGDRPALASSCMSTCPTITKRCSCLDVDARDDLGQEGPWRE